MVSFVLIAYASLAASRTLLQWQLVCLNFTLDSKDLFCWYKRKKWFLWTATRAAENHRNEWGLIWYLRWGIYTSVPTWTHPHNSLAAAEALNLRYPPMEHFSNNRKNHPHQQMHSRSCGNKASCIEFTEKLMETDTTTWLEFSNGGKAIAEQTLASEEKIQKSRTVKVTVKDPSRKVKHTSKIIWDRKILTEFARSISSIGIS